MPIAALEVEIVNKVTNLGAVAEEKAALSGVMGGGFTPLGGGTVSFGGSLTKQEQTVAAEQLGLLEGKAKVASTAMKDFEGSVGKAAVVSGSMGGVASDLTGKMGALGALGFTPAGMAILGVVAAAGAGVVVGKNLIENSDKQEAASKNLAQAYAYLGESVPTKALDNFLQTNARFIPNMYDAENALAALARAGFNDTMQFRLLNDALDMSAITGTSVSDAATVLIKAHEGQARSLAQFGISLKEVQAPEKALVEAHKEVTKATNEHTKAVEELHHWELVHHDRSKLTAADLDTETQLKIKVSKGTIDLGNANLDLAYAQNLVKEHGDQYLALLDTLEPKIKGGRQHATDLQQAQNRLGQEWDRLSNQLGPPLERALSDVFGAMGDLGDFVNHINWKPFLKGWQDDVVTPLTNFFGMLHGWGNDWNTFVRMLGGTTSGTGGGGSQTGYRGRNTTAPAQATASSRPRGFVNTRD